VRRFDDSAGDCRTSYTQRLAQSGLGYEQYAPTFRFGHGPDGPRPVPYQGGSSARQSGPGGSRGTQLPRPIQGARNSRR
jgi:hypothetical protein